MSDTLNQILAVIRSIKDDDFDYPRQRLPPEMVRF